MKQPIFIFGHQNPDTDSICSAIAYARLKHRIGITEAEARRLGPINKETQFVLDYFKVEAPKMLYNVKPQVSDIDLHQPIPVKKEACLQEAYNILLAQDQKLMPIVDDDGVLEGIATLGDISYTFLQDVQDDVYLEHEIIFDNLIYVLQASCINGKYPYDILEGQIYIDTMVNRHTPLTDKDIILTSNLNQVCKDNYKLNCGAIIVTNVINNETIKADLDKNCKVAIYSSPYNLFRAVSAVNQSISIKSVMCKGNLTAFSKGDYVEDVRAIISESKHRYFPVLDALGRYKGIVSSSDLLLFNHKNVILIDHNESNQSVAGLETASIVEVVDHHRIANIQTLSPLVMRLDPVGSTATIIYNLYKENNLEPERDMAGLLLSAILSDTLVFKSPTCTDEDIKAAKELAKLVNIDYEAYAREMFIAGTSLAGYTPETILAIDRKAFKLGSYTSYIAQVNTMDMDSVLDKKEELLKSMEDFCERKNVDLVVLLITNLETNGSELLFVGSGKKLVQHAYKITDAKADSVYLAGVVSRKKQVVPKLTASGQLLKG